LQDISQVIDSLPLLSLDPLEGGGIKLHHKVWFWPVHMRL